MGTFKIPSTEAELQCENVTTDILQRKEELRALELSIRENVRAKKELLKMRQENLDQLQAQAQDRLKLKNQELAALQDRFNINKARVKGLTRELKGWDRKLIMEVQQTTRAKEWSKESLQKQLDFAYAMIDSLEAEMRHTEAEIASEAAMA